MRAVVKLSDKDWRRGLVLMDHFSMTCKDVPWLVYRCLLSGPGKDKKGCTKGKKGEKQSCIPLLTVSGVYEERYKAFPIKLIFQQAGSNFVSGLLKLRGKIFLSLTYRKQPPFPFIPQSALDVLCPSV